MKYKVTKTYYKDVFVEAKDGHEAKRIAQSNLLFDKADFYSNGYLSAVIDVTSIDFQSINVDGAVRNWHFNSNAELEHAWRNSTDIPANDDIVFNIKVNNEDFLVDVDRGIDFVYLLEALDIYFEEDW